MEWTSLPSVNQIVKAPADLCYHIYTEEGYTRWPEWSPWLSKVETEMHNGTMLSRWFLTVKGIGVSWLSRNVQSEPGKLIRWESVSGVKQGGQCTFSAVAADETELCLELGFETPAPIALLFSGSWVRDFVEGRLNADMQRFALIAEREYQASLQEQDVPVVASSPAQAQTRTSSRNGVAMRPRKKRVVMRWVGGVLAALGGLVAATRALGLRL